MRLLVLIFFPILVMAYSPAEYDISFSAYVDKKTTSFDSSSDDYEYIETQLMYLISTLSLGSDDHGSTPPWGFRSIISKGYNLEIRELEDRDGLKRVHYSFHGTLLVDHNDSEKLEDIRVVLPINLETIFKRSQMRDGSNPCARFKLAQYFYANWRPWRKGCKLDKGLDYLEVSLEAERRYKQISLNDVWSVRTPNKVMSFFIWDLDQSRLDESDQTYADLKFLLNKQSRKQWRRGSVDYFEFRGWTIEVYFNELSDKSSAFIQKSFKNSDVFYYYGHAGVIEKFFDKYKRKPEFKVSEQLFIMDSCSSYYFDHTSLAIQKRVGGVSLLTTGLASEGVSRLPLKVINLIRDNGDIRYREITQKLGTKKNFLFLTRYLNKNI